MLMSRTKGTTWFPGICGAAHLQLSSSSPDHVKHETLAKTGQDNPSIRVYHAVTVRNQQSASNDAIHQRIRIRL